VRPSNDLGSAAGGTGYSDQDKRATLDLRPVAVELKLGKRGGRETTLDRADCLRCGGGLVGQFVHHTRCAGGVADQQRNLAVDGKFAYGVDQGIGAAVVEAVGDVHPIRWDLIAQLEQVECLPGADSTRAQHGIDRNALGPQIVTDLERGAFAIRGEPTLTVFTARSGAFGFRVAKYE
jgi:hypothetical protein